MYHLICIKVYEIRIFCIEPGYYDEKRGFGVRLETIVMAKYMSTVRSDELLFCFTI